MTTLIFPQSNPIDPNGRFAREWVLFFQNAANLAGSGVTASSSLTTGQLVLATASNSVGPFSAGTNGYVITMVGGVPAWAPAAAGSGTVTHTTGALTNHAITIGSGVSVDDIKTLAAMTDGQIVVGATGADPAPQTVSGDATLSAAGVLALTNAGRGGFDVVVMQAFGS